MNEKQKIVGYAPLNENSFLDSVISQYLQDDLGGQSCSRQCYFKKDNNFPGLNCHVLGSKMERARSKVVQYDTQGWPTVLYLLSASFLRSCKIEAKSSGLRMSSQISASCSSFSVLAAGVSLSSHSNRSHRLIGSSCFTAISVGFRSWLRISSVTGYTMLSDFCFSCLSNS